MTEDNSEPVLSTPPEILNVRELIEYAFGDFETNTVNFKLVQTVLLLIARQLRVLERRVEIELGPLTLIPSDNTLTITEVKIHAGQRKGKKPKQAGGGGPKPPPKTKKKGQQSSGSDKTSTDKTSSSDKKASDKTTTTDKTTTSTDKTTTSTDKTTTSTDKTTTSTDKTTTDKTTTSTDKTTTSTDKTTTTSTDKTTTTFSTDQTSTDKTTSSDKTAAKQKPYSNPDILSFLEEQRERELRIIHQRADSFEQATKSPTPMASVSSMQKQYETLLVVKKVSSKERSSQDTGRSPHISVVTQEQFEEIANVVRKLEKKFLPIGTPGFLENAELMKELRKNASLTDAMAALQLSARLGATEKVLAQMIEMVTNLAGQPELVQNKKGVVTINTPELDASGAPSTPGLDGRSRIIAAGPQPSSIGGATKSITGRPSTKSITGGAGTKSIMGSTATKSIMGVDAAKSITGGDPTTSAATTQVETQGFTPDAEPGDETKDNIYINFSDLQGAAKELYSDLLNKLKSETTRTTTTAETAYRTSINLESKLNRVIMVTSRMADLENVVKQYAEQVTALDTGLSSQMTSYQEQLTQMQHDLEIGVETISEVLASASGDVEAVSELHSNFTNLQVDLDVMAFRQKELKEAQNTTAYDLENLWKEIEMLRDTKSDREEVADALRDKAGIAQLNGLVALQQFEAVRGDFEKRIGSAYDKFNNQEHVWQKSIDELIKMLNEKGDLIQVETLRDDINKHLNIIKARLQIIADIVGEPKSAMVNKKVFRDTACLSCGSPAHIDLVEQNKVPALPKFPSGREPAEGAEAESQTKGAGDSRACFPDMPIPHPRDPRSHICKRYCGGSHTMITDGLNRNPPGLVVQPANRPTKTAPGTDGRIYKVDEQTKKVPCLPCNKPKPTEPDHAETDTIIDHNDDFGNISLTPPAQDLSY